jgi:hypothetical protein
VRDNYPILRRHHVQPLARILADDMHRRMTARTLRIFRRHCDMLARQMLRQRHALLRSAHARQQWLFLLFESLVPGEAGFEVFERQPKLVGRKLRQLFAARAKARIIGLAQQMPQMFVEALQPIARGKCSIAFQNHLRFFGSFGIAFCDGFQRQHAQAVDIVRKRIKRSVHTPSRTQLHANAMNFPVGDSIDRIRLRCATASARQGSLHGLRPGDARNMHALPVHALQKRTELRRRQTHHAVLKARPAELAVLETLCKQA